MSARANTPKPQPQPQGGLPSLIPFPLPISTLLHRFPFRSYFAISELRDGQQHNRFKFHFWKFPEHGASGRRRGSANSARSQKLGVQPFERAARDPARSLRAFPAVPN